MEQACAKLSPALSQRLTAISLSGLASAHRRHSNAYRYSHTDQIDVLSADIDGAYGSRGTPAARDLEQLEQG